jgi:prepilin-type processing-associated H-X9-DG protein
VALFADAGYRGGSNKFMRAPGNTVELNAGMIHAGTNAFCHEGCCNACFLDGHSAAFSAPCKSPVSTTQLLKYVTDFPKNGFLSGDDCAYDPR